MMAARRWRPSPFLQASAWWHAAALAGLALAPAAWPWVLAALAVNHALITAAGLLPRTRWLGPNITRLPAAPTGQGRVALTIDDGPDPAVTPRMLDVLDEHGMVASFFLIGRRAERYPALCRAIVERGHRVENHGYSHSHALSLMGPAALRADIARAQAVLADLSGQAPRFFRPTAGLRNPFLEPVLCRLGLQLASWSRRGFDTRQGDPAVVLRRLCRDLGDGDILLLHDGHAARTVTGEAVSLAILPSLAQCLRERRLGTTTLHDAVHDRP
jgi:peptidoglycan/xylan/chitin deacetylase (PgdA/CDA1 family)